MEERRHLTLPGEPGSLPGGGDSWRINLNQVYVSRQIQPQIVRVWGVGNMQGVGIQR